MRTYFARVHQRCIRNWHAAQTTTPFHRHTHFLLNEFRWAEKKKSREKPRHTSKYDQNDIFRFFLLLLFLLLFLSSGCHCCSPRTLTIKWSGCTQCSGTHTMRKWIERETVMTDYNDGTRCVDLLNFSFRSSSFFLLFCVDDYLYRTHEDVVTYGKPSCMYRCMCILFNACSTH